MKLIVGLGNPGKQYEKTRHNLGFMAVEQFLKDYEEVRKTIWEDNKRLKSDVAQFDWQPRHGKLEQVVLVKPKTYMNNSGMAVKLLTAHFLASRSGSLLTSNVWVVHDDIDLPLGTMRIRFGGAAAGHHGVESVMEHLGTDKFFRFRLGTGVRRNHFNRDVEEKKHAISRDTIKNVEDYVLSPFTARERGKVKNLIKRASKAIQMAFEEGMDAAMNRFNTK